MIFRSSFGEISYLTQGNSLNPSLLFFHGFMGSKEDWLEVISKLQTHFHCIAVDLPGHGSSKSFVPDPVKAFEQTTKAMKELLDFVNIANITHCVGYSMGGRIALSMLELFPGIFQSLVLESVSPGIADPQERQNRWLNDQALAIRLQSDSLGKFLNDWYKLPLFGHLNRHPRFDNLLLRRLSNNPQILARALLAFSPAVQQPQWDNLKKMVIPVKLICGADDAKYVEIVSRMHSLNPAFGISVIKSCAHNTHFEQAGLFAEIVMEFLT